MGDNARHARSNARRKVIMLEAGKHQAPEPKTLTKEQQDELARRERIQRSDNRRELQDKGDQLKKSCPEGDLEDCLWNEAVPGTVNRGYWDGKMRRQPVDGDGNCFIHTILRCSDYDPLMPEDAPDYKTKVSKLRAEIVAYMVAHADSEVWRQSAQEEGFLLQRGGKT